MKRLALLPVLALFVACGDTPTEAPQPVMVAPAFTVIGSDNPNGAIVLNKGEASEPFTASCRFAGRLTNEVTLMRGPNGSGLVSCHWSEFENAPTLEEAIVIKGFNCFLNFLGFSETNRSHFVLTPAGTANLNCTFDNVEG